MPGAGDAVEAECCGVAFENVEPSPDGGRMPVARERYGKPVRRRMVTIPSELRAAEGVLHRGGVGRDARVGRIVIHEGDVEPVVTVRPDVEVRSVVLSEIDRVGQYPVPAHGADQQIRGAARSVRGVLLPLVGDGCDRPLRIGQHIEVARGLTARERDGLAVGTVFRSVGRCGVGLEQGYRKRYGAELHGTKLHVRRAGGDAVRDLRCAARDLDGGKLYDAACRGGNVDPSVAGHRQYVGITVKGGGEAARVGHGPRVPPQVGCDMQAVRAGDALEAQGRGGLVTAQDDIAVRIAQPPVHVAQRPVVRRAGRDRHGVRPHGKLHRNLLRAVVAAEVVLAAARKAAREKERRNQNESFHVRRF